MGKPDILRAQIADVRSERHYNKGFVPLDLSLMVGTGVLTPLFAIACLISPEEMAQKAGVLLLAGGMVTLLASARITCVRIRNVEDLMARERQYRMNLYKLEANLI